MTEIVLLERDNVGSDVDITKFGKLGNLTAYSTTKSEEVAERLKDAEVAIINKMPMNESTLQNANKLKMIAVMATGIDNVDIDYCIKRGITVKNVSGYSTASVVQHTFAMTFYLYEKLAYYDSYVKEGKYFSNPTFSYFQSAFHEIAGKTWGIVGLGEIGRRVASIATMFGCNVIYYSTSGKNHDKTFHEVDFNTLLKESDIITIHAPLNDLTKHLFNEQAFDQMKKEAYLINVGRGPIVSENALYQALTLNQIAGAALDVLEKEPMAETNPLYQIKDSQKLLITPHIAWATVEARTRLMQEVYRNVSEYLADKQ